MAALWTEKGWQNAVKATRSIVSFGAGTSAQSFVEANVGDVVHFDQIMDILTIIISIV